MNSLLRLMGLVVALGFSTPAIAATVAYSFEATGGLRNPDARLSGQLSFDLGGGQLFEEGRLFQRFSGVASLSGTVTGGSHNGFSFERENLSIVSIFTNLVSIFFVGDDQAGLSFYRWNERDISPSDVSVLSFTSGAAWLSPQNNTSFERYSVNTLNTAELVSVPLPATFPLFLGLCLGTAFFGRKRRRA